ncbi:CoA transferase [Nocardia sp. NPDC050378]|uniref:CoA transferase n=1 Tax=Nocardia sp. NPDC050378 TaxID=3155400 RepID=UPI0033D3DAF4
MRPSREHPDTAAAQWAASGALWLTGDPAGKPDHSRAAIVSRARLVADSFTAATGVPIDVGIELAGRAAQLGLSRRGRISAGGATRLLEASDGWCALTLARAGDWAAVPALVATADYGTAPGPDIRASSTADSVVADAWKAITRWSAQRPATDVVARARLLGLPAAVLGEQAPARPIVRRIGPAGAARTPAGCLVVDLSSMWAGPLCGRLLRQAGATVIKVESPSRPDGTRAGAPAFFDWMNAGKLCYATDFDDARLLRELLLRADVVLESSRPAALTRRGLGPELPARPGRVWARITAHGTGHGAHWTGFGDDAAVAGGLVAVGAGGPYFCADAVADPLTGLKAARAVVESLARGGGELIELSLSAVAAEYAALPIVPATPGLLAARPTAPTVTAHASRLGGDNAAVHLLADSLSRSDHTGPVDAHGTLCHSPLKRSIFFNDTN